MKERFISMIISICIIFSLLTPVFAAGTADNETYDFSGCTGGSTEISLKSYNSGTYSLQGAGSENVTMTFTGSSSIIIGGFGTYVCSYKLTFQKAGLYELKIVQEGTNFSLAYTAKIVDHDWEGDSQESFSCNESGYRVYVCKNCGMEESRYVAASGHTQEIVPGRAATCTQAGLTDGVKCSVCNKVLAVQKEIPATGHSWGQWEVISEPTLTQTGKQVHTCTVCQTEETQTTPALGTPAPSEPNPSEPAAPTPPSDSGFSDVPSGAYYNDAVTWAVAEQITTGTTATTFSPNAVCTRGQIVTLLWRTFGCPEPSVLRNPFTDVSADAYYYEAVVWAVEAAVTTGTSETTFSPDAPCTRGQIAALLWRVFGEPTPGKTSLPFTDVSPSAYYYTPIVWSLEKGLTNGTSATAFSPNAPCTRAQIVTFLYRALA